MLVEQILNSKAGEGVVTVATQSSVSDAMKVLVEKGIGTVVVSDDGQNAAGILSERDIVRALTHRGAGILNDKVDNLMTSKLVTCGVAESADTILQKMTDGRFRHMPVLEDGKMIGLISLGDVVKARLSELAMEKDALEGMIMGH